VGKGNAPQGWGPQEDVHMIWLGMVPQCTNFHQLVTAAETSSIQVAATQRKPDTRS